MSSTSSCTAKWTDEVNRFERLLYTSVLLTLANMLVSRILIAKGMEPLKLAYYHFGTGGIKVILGIAIIATIPNCPSGCSCVGGHVNPIVGLIPLIIGVGWLVRGYRFYKSHKSSSSSSNSATMEDNAPASGENQVV